MITRFSAEIQPCSIEYCTKKKPVIANATPPAMAAARTPSSRSHSMPLRASAGEMDGGAGETGVSARESVGGAGKTGAGAGEPGAGVDGADAGALDHASASRATGVDGAGLG